MARTTEEQINGLGERINHGCPDLPLSQILARNYILEAEQRGYEQARAECADDTKRLEWLESVAVSAEDVGIHCLMNTSGETSFGVFGTGNYAETLRSAIDAAMKEDGQ